MDRSTEILCERLKSAMKPEDVFGSISGTSTSEQTQNLKRRFREFMLLVHPDRNPNLVDSGTHVHRLVEFEKEAEKLLRDGEYGKSRRTVYATLKSKRGEYVVTGTHRVGEVADILLAERGTKTCLLKVVRTPSDNDLLDIEARVLDDLFSKKDTKSLFFQQYIPPILDSFPLIQNGVHRKVNVFDVAEGYFSLAEIREAYPDGIDPQDVAWMLRRTFEVLGWVHTHKYVHGAVLPEHVLVHPVEHGAKLVGWSYAVKAGQRLTAISSSRKGMYPGSVGRREAVNPALDVQMAVETACLLLSDRKGRVLDSIPRDIVNFFTLCRFGKIKDGWEAYTTYNEVLSNVYGKRKYRAFAMPRV